MERSWFKLGEITNPLNSSYGGAKAMPIKTENLFDNIPADLPQELIQEIVQGSQVRIERIISKGHKSAKGFWYDQPWDEWVLLLQGGAGLEVTNQPSIIELNAGDHLWIPAGVKHRVAWTDRDVTTLWLAVHIHGPNGTPMHPENQTK